MFPFEISSPKERGVLQVSKWIKYPVLLDAEELTDLIETIQAHSSFFIGIVSEVVSENGALVDSVEFLNVYRSYIEALQRGEIPDQGQWKKYFSSVFVSSLDSLYAMQVGPSKYLIKPASPVIQLQAHHFFYSNIDHQFHSMALSRDSVTWGLQFAYPQIFQDPLNNTISKVGPGCINTALFEALGRWMRKSTLPTPFVVDGKRTNAPIRLGKQCLKWVSAHPQLVEKKIGIFPVTGAYAD